jgi:hypothetical protein
MWMPDTGMTQVRAVQQRNRVTTTQPARLGSRAWEADPEGFFDAGNGRLILSGSEHDPRLAPGDDDE